MGASVIRNNMQLFVKTHKNTLTVDVAANTTVDGLKQAIENMEFLPAESQRLVCAGAQMEGSRLLSNFVEEADTVTLYMDVVGGMRAKWRKKRMRRLRRKRRKMRQRAR